ncbi:MAG: Sulfatase, partial [uncultured Adhaeribacter sp.]
MHDLPANRLDLFRVGAGYDCLLFFKLSALLVVPFTILFWIRHQLAAVFYFTVTSLLTIGYLGLIYYFSVSLVPLGADLFGYSWAEIEHTVSVSNSFNWLVLLPVIGVIGGLVGLSILFARTRFSAIILSAFTILLGISLFLSSGPDAKAYPSDMAFYLVNNKLEYFLTKSYRYWNQNGDDNEDHTAYYLEEERQDVHTFKYITNEYPFLHQTQPNNVLGNFFKLDSVQKPNLVFVVVESLGRAYSGDNAYLGSFTPFLDSLSNHSLYFPNFLSTSGRTFGVLPGLFGALPFAEKGFLEQGEKMPQHLSLISLLKAQGYQTGFNYGGAAHFDQMDTFLKKQGIDYILEESGFGPGYEKLPAKQQGGFSWGYGDRELFRKSLASLPVTTKPRLDIYLTVATHEPFLIPNQTTYMQQAEHRFSFLKLSENQKQEHRKYLKQYSTLLYLDDAIRYFITEYSRRPEFKNTIF